MSDAKEPPIDAPPSEPRPNPVADREQLRDQLSKRFEHTLRRLAR